jgi:hypothetical protein
MIPGTHCMVARGRESEMHPHAAACIMSPHLPAKPGL